MAVELPRNQRLLNPGNIRRTQPDTPWLGAAPEQLDADYVTFTDAKYGFRAMARIVLGYYKHGDESVYEIISRWAPTLENNTMAYVRDVANRMNVAPLEALSLPQQLLPLLRSIAIHEGGCPWSDAVIQVGIYLEGTARSA